MNTRLFRIMLAILLLALATLACGLVADEPTPDEGGLATATEAGVAPPTIAPTTASEEETQPTNTAEPTGPPEIALDEEYRSEDGGYTFCPVPDYEFEEAFGFASMTAPDGDSETGPMILMIGDVLDEAASLDELRENQLSTISSEDVQISDPVDIVVGGAPGVSVEIRGTDDGVEVAGRIVVVLVNPTQQLTVLAGAPVDRWESELAPIVDAVLASVTFFEPGTDVGDSLGDEPLSEPVELDAEYRSEKGGYLFNQIPDYSLEETDGYTMLMAPDGDSQIGPSIFLMGGTRGESLTLDELYNEQIQNFNPGDNVILSPYRDVTVGGAPGRSVDLTGTTNEGLDMTGRVTIVLVNPNQMFLMGAISPPGRWEELSGIYETLQASVAFFEPGTSQPESVQPQGEEIRQWAKTAYASSSYDSPDWNASQATGAPDVLADECEDSPLAWASYDSDTVEWLELVYETPVIPTEINIIQTHSPDQVVKVELIDRAGLYQVVYTGVPVDHWMECPYTLSIPVDVDFAVGGLKITIDQSVIASPWDEIDAVELVGFPYDESSAVPPTGDPALAFADGTLYLQDPPVPSEDTYQVSTRLMELGYEICEPSNFFTAQTESAVMRFQEVNGLTADGIVGPETWEQLFNDAAIPATLPPVVYLPVYLPPSSVSGGAMAHDWRRLWVLEAGFHTLAAYKISPEEGQEFAGLFNLEALPGEDDYTPQTMTYDDTYLWVASQGADDAILQAYDTDVDPVVGVLTPQWAQSIHIEDVFAINGLSFEGDKLWLAFEGLAFPSGLVSIDPQSGEVGQTIEFGLDAYARAPAFDGKQLWVPLEGYYGAWAIRSVDPASGEIGAPLGICGMHVAYDTTALWVADGDELWIVDTYSGEGLLTVPLEIGQVRSMIFAGGGVWVLNWEGALAYYRIL